MHARKPSCAAAASNDVEPVLYAPKLKTTSRSLTGPLYSNESKSCVLLPCTTCWQTSTKCFGSIFPAALSRSFPAKRSAASASRWALIFSCSAFRAATRSAAVCSAPTGAFLGLALPAEWLACSVAGSTAWLVNGLTPRPETKTASIGALSPPPAAVCVEGLVRQ